ncbi:ZP domain-containing protein [Trichonephila inaurata madagascariensis]|uniref:ZP domain-containing protein n=1 Tax=Trichonephila inaurata madagascariensis TaxID=2747483 RepID=A0A8X6M707_9ARAC|nr:ZP domain-containing protein [Trichonephila inaurata madagascariensis]
MRLNVTLPNKNEAFFSCILTSFLCCMHLIENFGEFSNDIVIQHHDMIVTNQDLGLSVHCQYDLSNRSVSHGVQLEINGEVDAAGTQSATVSSPNVTMMITDRQGYDISAAQVGDALALRFEIIDANS